MNFRYLKSLIAFSPSKIIPSNANNRINHCPIICGNSNNTFSGVLKLDICKINLLNNAIIPNNIKVEGGGMESDNQTQEILKISRNQTTDLRCNLSKKYSS